MKKIYFLILVALLIGCATQPENKPENIQELEQLKVVVLEKMTKKILDLEKGQEALNGAIIDLVQKDNELSQKDSELSQTDLRLEARIDNLAKDLKPLIAKLKNYDNTVSIINDKVLLAEWERRAGQKAQGFCSWKLSSFPAKVFALSDKQKKELDFIKNDCNILEVGGYASTDGKDSDNETLAQKRLDSALAYLGITRDSITILEVRETDQFGSRPINRTVVFTGILKKSQKEEKVLEPNPLKTN